MRDEKLDIYRGLIMMYIIGFIHTLYWFPNFGTKIKSFFLFEMAVVFFITGASYSLSNKKSYAKYIISRIPRILIPYFIFIIFLVLIEYVANILGTTITYLSFKEFVISSFNVFKEPSVTLQFVTWHLWFIPVYLILVPFIPVMYNLYNALGNKFNYIPMILISCLIVYMHNIDNLTVFKNVIFYAFWIYGGFFYNKLKEIKISKLSNLIIITLMSAILIYLISKDQFVMDMQKNKFPPNFIFLIYTIIAFNLLYILRDYILNIGKIKCINRLVNQYSTYGFTLYLYHPFTYLLVRPIYIYLFDISENIIYKIIMVLINTVLVIYLNLIFARSFGKFENIKILIKGVQNDKKNLYEI